MPQVPYSPVPGEGPSGLNPAVSRLGYTPSIHVNPPLAAFGGATAAAQERLGGAIQQVGGTLSDIAVQRQAIENTASTNDLAVQAEIEIGALKTEGYSKEGKAAIDFSNEFGTRVQAIREKYLNQAPNAAVGRDLDNALRRSVGYALINWGQHVATQEKAYARQGAEARIGVATQAALGSSESELNSRIEEAKASARYLTRDAPAETQKLAVDKAESDIRAARLNYDAVTDARGALDSYRKHIDKILPSDRKALEDQLFRAAGVHGAAQIANQAASPQGPQTLKDLVAQHETGSAGPESYDVVYNRGHDLPPPKPVTQMTLNEILSYQQHGKAISGSRAFPVGRYQIIQSTLSDLINSMELTGNEKFTPALQERMADVLIARRGGSVGGLRDEWESLKGVSAEEIKSAARAPSTQQGRGTEAQVVERAKQIAAAYLPANKFGKERADEFMDRVVSSTLTRFGVDVKIERDAQFGATQTVYAAMNDDKYSTLDEALKDPEVDKAFSSLPPTAQDSVRHHFEVKARQADNQETEEQRTKYEDLLGKALLDPKGFLDVDLAREDLSKKGTGKLLTQRDKIFKGIVEEVKMGGVLSELKTAGFFNGLDFKEKAGQNNAKLQAFTGALHTKIMDDKVVTGKMPDHDRQMMLARQLIRTNPGWFGTSFGETQGLNEEAAKELIEKGAPLNDFQRRWQSRFPGRALPPLIEQLKIIRAGQQ